MSAYQPVSTKKQHGKRTASSVNSSSNSDDELFDQEYGIIEQPRLLNTLPTGTLFTSTINISNTILGTGMLAMVKFIPQK